MLLFILMLMLLLLLVVMVVMVALEEIVFVCSVTNRLYFGFNDFCEKCFGLIYSKWWLYKQLSGHEG